MTRVVEAIYEDGMLKPLQDPELEEHQRVLLMIRVEPQEGSQTTLEDWQRVYEGLSDEEIAAIEALRESLASDSSNGSSARPGRGAGRENALTRRDEADRLASR